MSNLYRNFLNVGVMTTGSRVLGFVRDALVAVWAALELPREVSAEAHSETKLNPGDLTLPTVGG